MAANRLWSALFALVLALVAFDVGTRSRVSFAQPDPVGAPQSAASAGTAFTYQGQLKQNGALVNGNCTVQFKLYADAGATSIVAGPVSGIPNPVSVTNGLFTMQVDFGSGAFQGDARWLQPSAGCGSENMFTPLSLQPLTPAPIALALPGMYTQQNATSPNLIGGYSGNIVDGGAYGATIGGGGRNGDPNHVSGSFGSIGGGIGNRVSLSGIGNGFGATIGGGVGNNAGGYDSTIGGGAGNSASNQWATIGGGSGNQAYGDHATIGGGGSNNAGYFYATIGGGYTNTVSGAYATIGGGYGNIASGNGAFVGGGGTDGTNILANIAQGNTSVIGGGISNTVTLNGYLATIGGGDSNTADGDHATIGGGNTNRASGAESFVGGGASNVASAIAATVSGGRFNTASEIGATVPGGSNASATHYGEMAYASGYFANFGDAQTSLYVLRNSTTDAAQTELFLDGFSQRITLANNRTLSFEILVTARSIVGESAGYRIWGVIKNVGGTTTMVGANGLVMGNDGGFGSATADPDTIHNALVVHVNGVNGKTIRWVATVRTTEVAY